VKGMVRSSSTAPSWPAAPGSRPRKLRRNNGLCVPVVRVRRGPALRVSALSVEVPPSGAVRVL
jgi:hypothetical protein